MHYAADYGHLEVVKLLLDRGANINATDNFGRTSFHDSMTACYALGNEIAMLMLSNGADVHLKIEGGVFPLHLAALQGDLDLLTAILKKGADVLAKTENGCTSLHCATFQTNEEIVRTLLDNGVDVHQKAGNGMTALHFAILTSTADIMWPILLLSCKQRHASAEVDEVKDKVMCNDQNIEISLGSKEKVFSLERSEILAWLCNHFDDDHIYPYLTAGIHWLNNEHDRALEFFEQSIELDPVNASISDVDQVQHRYFSNMYDQWMGSFICDDCGENLVGVRYSCKECPGFFDLCQKCYQKPTWPQHESKASHEVMQIPRKGWKPRVKDNGYSEELASRKCEKLEA